MVIIALFGCGKDKLETRPSIKFKSVNSTEIFRGMRLEVFLEFSDKEGDLSLGEVVYFRDRLNLKPPPPLTDKADTVFYSLAEFPVRSTGEIQVNIPYDFMDEDLNDDDTMMFRFSVKDAMGNVSDTIDSPIVIARGS